MNDHEKRQIIVHSEIFKNIDLNHIDHIITAATIVSFPKNHYILRQNELNHYLYIIISGIINITTKRDGIELTINSLSSPQSFGESGLLDIQQSMANVIADTEVSLLCIPYQTLKNNLSIYSGLCLNLAKSFYNRLNETNQNTLRYYENSLYDKLTGLPNRVLLQTRLQEAILTAKQNDTFIGVLFLDLNKFKLINDSFGHDTGDEVLRIFAERLKIIFRTTDTVARFDMNIAARLGGDEFVIVLPYHDETLIPPIIQRILNVLKSPYMIQNQLLNLSVSIGVSLYPEDGEQPSTLLKHADIAMYTAKKTGANTVKFYSKTIS
jgi:diguanylate cyclase (GGDEF)-like protein